MFRSIQLLALLILLSALPVRAGEWIPGPRTTEIIDLVATDDAVYAAADQSLWAGDARGDAWAFLEEAEHVLNVVVHPDRPDRIFASTMENILRSDDGGRTWDVLTHDLLLPYALDVTIDPSDPDRIWRLRDPFPEAWLSTDGGDTWELRALGLQNASGVKGLEIAPSNAEHLYIVSYGGVFASTDEGASWAERAPVNTEERYSLAIDPFDSQKLYVATNAGVFRSVNGGRTWIEPTFGFDADGRIRLDPDNNAVLYAPGTEGLYRSMDSGASWTRIFDQPTKAVTFQGTGQGRVLYAGGEGIYRSEDDGASWARADDSALLGALVNKIASDPKNPDVVFAAFDHRDGLYRSLDGGNTWTQVFADVSAHAVAIVPGTETVYFGWAPRTTGSPHFYRSFDLGETWTVIDGDPSLATRFVWDITIHPRNDRTLFISNGHGFWRSDDAGAHWQQTGGVSTSLFGLFDPQNPNILYAGGFRGQLTKSVDGGSTWTRLDPEARDENIKTLAISPRDSKLLLLAYEDGKALRSTNGGLTWNEIAGSEQWQGLSFDPDRPGYVYATSLDSAMYMSTDDGISWQLMDESAGFPGSVVSLNPVDSHVFYLGTRGGSVQTRNFADVLGCPQESPKALCFRQGRFKVEARLDGPGRPERHVQIRISSIERIGAFLVFLARELRADGQALGRLCAHGPLLGLGRSHHLRAARPIHHRHDHRAKDANTPIRRGFPHRRSSILPHCPDVRNTPSPAAECTGSRRTSVESSKFFTF